MQPLFRTVWPTFFWIGAAFIGIPGLCDSISGITRSNPVDIARGIGSSLMAAYLVYCALLCKRGDGALLSKPSIVRTGYIVLAIFAAGFFYEIVTTAKRVFF